MFLLCFKKTGLLVLYSFAIYDIDSTLHVLRIEYLVEKPLSFATRGQ